MHPKDFNALDRTVLDRMVAYAKANTPEGQDTQVIIQCQLHEEAGANVQYLDGQVLVMCKQCGRTVAIVAVAEQGPVHGSQSA